jgi:uncharacterized membrane protein YcjF (UPF0283 family)
VDWTIYGALIVGFLAIAAAAGYLVVQVLQGWRAYKRLRRRAAKELARLAEAADASAEAAARASDQPRLNASLARLRIALAQFAVLRNAFDEATDALGRFAAVYPRK